LLADGRHQKGITTIPLYIVDLFFFYPFNFYQISFLANRRLRYGPRRPADHQHQRALPPAARAHPSIAASEFEREYFSFFCIPPARLCKFIWTQFDDPETADFVMQHNPNFVCERFMDKLDFGDPYYFPDVNSSDDDYWNVGN